MKLRYVSAMELWVGKVMKVTDVGFSSMDAALYLVWFIQKVLEEKAKGAVLKKAGGFIIGKRELYVYTFMLLLM